MKKVPNTTQRLSRLLNLENSPKSSLSDFLKMNQFYSNEDYLKFKYYSHTRKKTDKIKSTNEILTNNIITDYVHPLFFLRFLMFLNKLISFFNFI